MSGKIFSVALLAAVCFAGTASADLRGPAEMPPASFKGQQYVDSRGCVFLRAGHGGRQTWVPRIAQDRKQLCGYAPSGRNASAASAGTKAAATSIPTINTGTATARTGKPLPLPAPMQSAYNKAGGKPAASGTVVVNGVVLNAPKNTTPANPAAIPARSAAGAADGYRLSCPATVPVAQRFRVEGGGTRTLCTKGDGTLTGAKFPRLVSTASGGHDLGSQAWSGIATSMQTGQTITVVRGKTRSGSAVPTPPAGYKLAWEDDRLNPKRGLQTMGGIITQEETWSRTTPARIAAATSRKVTVRMRHGDGTFTDQPGFVDTAADGRETIRLATGARVAKSTKSEPAAVIATAKTTAQAGVSKGTARVFVQVGTYGVPANAEGTAGRLQGLGLPVARSNLRGGALQVVYAGPFASGGEAQAALSRLRGAGFGDALIVQ